MAKTRNDDNVEIRLRFYNGSINDVRITWEEELDDGSTSPWKRQNGWTLTPTDLASIPAELSTKLNDFITVLLAHRDTTYPVS